MPDFYINGQFVPEDKATVSFVDAGMQHAVGLFDTLFAWNGRAFRAGEHMERLATSARELGLSRDIRPDALVTAIHRCLEHNQLERARIRVTLTAGAVSLLRPDPATPPQPTVGIACSEPTEFDLAYFEKGITVIIAPPLANPFDPMVSHKTLAYWQRLRTLRQAATAGAGEAIWLNITNHLASGAISNLFLVRDGTLLTPIARGEEIAGALLAPVLPGITRKLVLDLAREQEIPTETRMLSVDDLLEADEVFLTNSNWLVLPVTRIEKQVVASGSAGPITLRLREAVLETIQKETSVSGGH